MGKKSSKGTSRPVRTFRIKSAGQNTPDSQPPRQAQASSNSRKGQQPVESGSGPRMSRRQIIQAVNDKLMSGELTTPEISPSKPASRVRRYLKPEHGRSWNVDSPETPEGRLTRYNPEDWYAPAQDDKGHPTRIMMDFHPAMIEQLAAHVNSGKFPLQRSVKQAIRVALLEFLLVLDKLEPLPNSHAAVIETATYLNQHAEVTLGYEEKFETGRQKVWKLVRMGAENEARKMAHDLMALTKRIPSIELRDRYQDKLEGEFKFLFKMAKGARTNVRKNKLRNTVSVHDIPDPDAPTCEVVPKDPEIDAEQSWVM